MTISKKLLRKICSTRSAKLMTASSIAVLLSACGGSGQDDGSASSFTQVFSGVGIDGYLARSTVFIDSNNNGTRDSWEAWAFTDNDGYYSYNPITGTDYCASDATAQESQYCLVADVQYSNVVIRIDSGYDVVTGEPFLGQLSRRVNAEVAEEVSDSVVSPITSLLSNVDSTSDRTSLLSSLSITEDDLNVDYLNPNGGAVNAPLLNTALKIHKTVTVLSDRLTDTYTEIGEDFGTPNDATSSVYPNLAQQIINTGTSIDVALTDESTLASVLDAAEQSLREVYERKEFTLPNDIGSTSNPDGFQRVIDISSQIPDVVNTLIDRTDTGFDLDEAVGSTKALESLVLKTVNETSTVDTTINNAINFFQSDTNQDLIDALKNSLSQDLGDVTTLANNDFAGEDFDNVDDIVNASSLPTDATPFGQIGGMQLRVSDLDLGSAPSNLEDKEVEFYFQGDANDISGSFMACVKFIDGANIDGTLGDANTRGEIIDGFWSLLGASQSDVESFNLLITLTFLGSTYQAIIKPGGTETIDGIEYQQFRSDYDGELRTFHSRSGLVALESIPTSNQSCEEKLPSRVGI